MLPEEYLGENRWTEFYDTDNDPQPLLATGKITVINPVGNDIIINSSESLLTGNAQCEIHSVSGQLMHAEQVVAIHERDVVNVTTQQELPNGIYLLTLSSAEGKITEKFLIAR